MKHFLKYHLAFLVWLLVIFIQSSLPAITLPKVEIISADKLVHAGVFGLLAFLCYISIIHLKSDSFVTASPLVWSSVFCILYGASDEIHQYFVPNRSSEVQDWAADVLGVIVAVLLIKYFLKQRYLLFGKEIPNGA